jgi:hypothetical protein
MAWQCISPVVNVKGFKKYYISNAVDETSNNNMLWNGGEEDGNVRNECGEDTDCEDGDSDTNWQRHRESNMFCVLSVGK